jgi:hypothetical protein
VHRRVGSKTDSVGLTNTDSDIYVITLKEPPLPLEEIRILGCPEDNSYHERNVGPLSFQWSSNGMYPGYSSPSRLELLLVVHLWASVGNARLSPKEIALPNRCVH